VVAEAREWVDVEVAVREWTRDNVPGADRRVFFATNDQVTDPQIVVQRIAGPDDAVLVQFDVWANKKATAAALAAELASAADALSAYFFNNVSLKGMAVESVRWQPDPESNEPRYIVEVIVAAAAS
jgi:hypothetical protein